MRKKKSMHIKIDGVTVHLKFGRYYLVVVEAERLPTSKRHKRKWVGLTRESEGLEALRAALNAYRFPDGAPAERGGNWTMWTKLYRASYLGTISDESRRRYDHAFNVLDKAFGSNDVHELEPGHFLNWIKEHYVKPGKLDMAIFMRDRLNTFYKWLALSPGETKIERNPIQFLKGTLSRGPDREGRMSPDIFWKLHEALPPIGQAFLRLSYLTGQRPTDIRLLHPKQFEVEPGYIYFKPTKTQKKTGKHVLVKIDQELQDALAFAKEASAQTWANNQRKRKVMSLAGREYILQRPNGGPWGRAMLYRMWDTARKKVGITTDPDTSVTTRDIRPFSLHDMEEAGASLKDIAVRAAHKKQTTTEGYLNQHRVLRSNLGLKLPPRPSTAGGKKR